MSQWRVTIANYLPPRINEWDGRRWAVRARIKKTCYEMIASYVLMADVPKATSRRRVSLELTIGPLGRGMDPDAFLKATLDALVACGALVDDSARWCELGTPTVERGPEPRTVIVLEDVDEVTR